MDTPLQVLKSDLFRGLAQPTRIRDELPAVVVFRLRNMTAIDATGLRALEDAARRGHATMA